MVLQKFKKCSPQSFRQEPESSNLKHLWTPAFAGVTGWGTFCEFVNFDSSAESVGDFLKSINEQLFDNILFLTIRPR
jgi:hypothetical protein